MIPPNLKATIAVLILLAVVPAAADDLRVFAPDSLRAIERAYAGSRFVVAVWASDCSPCRAELEMLGRFAIAYPDVPVVLIATDGEQNHDLVARILEHYRLAAADTWLFGPAGAERLRYAIDPGWHGELPRSYLYDAAGNRAGKSGRLDAGYLRNWLEANRPRCAQLPGAAAESG